MAEKTCSDCVYVDVCENKFSWLDQDDNTKYITCHHFKDKTDVVKVVRCKDCKYLKYGYQCYCPLGMNLSNNEDAYVLVNANKDFCSYGTPKERGGEK